MNVERTNDEQLKISYRYLALLLNQWGLDKCPTEIRVLDVSPSGEWVKVAWSDWSQWLERDSIKVIEKLL